MNGRGAPTGGASRTLGGVDRIERRNSEVDALHRWAATEMVEARRRALHDHALARVMADRACSSVAQRQTAWAARKGRRRSASLEERTLARFIRPQG